MAISYIVGDIDSEEPGVDLVFTLNTGLILPGHTMFLIGEYPSGGDPGWVGPSDLTGWTELTAAARPGLPAGSAQANGVHTIWVRKFTGSVPSSITLTNVGGASTRAMGAMYGVWSGVDETTATYTTTYDTSGTQTSRDHPSVIVPGSGGLVIMAGDWDASDITAPRVYPTSYTERHYLNHTESTGFVNTQYMGSNENVGPGATGLLPFSWAVGNGAAKVLFSIAAAAAAAGGGSTPPIAWVRA